MGRNQRHKKDLRAEKAKVKLKTTKTKFLPKGLNVTKTDFKIKPIVLLEQLKAKDIGVPLSKRKLDVKDLLSRIKHYNENVRHGACEELVDMIKIHSEEIMIQHLSQIILNVSSLMQDRERKVRKAAIKVVNAILEIIPEGKVEPFFSYFLTNMQCAMTNIDRNIQEDSLLFLDCFLKYNCGLISKYSEKLLPNFFTLISKLRSDSNLSRTLTVNLGSKMTSVTWRIKVLSRLHAVLESTLHCHEVKEIDRKNTGKNVKDADACNAFPIYKESFCKTLENVTDFDSSEKSCSMPDVLNCHIIMLVPLLYEIWIEVVPEKKIGKAVTESTILNEETSTVLSCIMNTLYLLWKYVKNIENDINVSNVFLSIEGKKFLSHLLTNFPYCQTENKIKQNKVNNGLKILEINSDPKCTKENILICYIYCVLNINYLHKNLRIEMEGITAYITKCLLTNKYVDRNSTWCLIEFLNTCLVESPLAWKRAGADLRVFLESTITFYHHNAINEKYKMEVFNILSNIVDNPLLKKLHQYNIWLSSLPNLLCGSKITDILVEALLKFSRKNNEVFHQALLKQLPKILDNLDTLNIVLTHNSLINNEKVVKRNIVNIFFFVPVLHKEQLERIANFMTKHPHLDYCLFFKDMLLLRLDMKYSKSFEDNLKKIGF